MIELKLTHALTAIGNIDKKLKENFNFEEGERIIFVPIKIKINKGGFICKEENPSFLQEYNKQLLKNDVSIIGVDFASDESKTSYHKPQTFRTNGYEIGDKLVCKIANAKTFAPSEVVTIEGIKKQDELYIKFQGYEGWYEESIVEKIFGRY